MIALPSQVGDDVVLCSRDDLQALLPLRGLIVVHALWLDWTLLLLRRLGECHGCVILRGGGGGGGGGEGGGCYDLPGSVVSPVDVVFVW